MKRKKPKTAITPSTASLLRLFVSCLLLPCLLFLIMSTNLEGRDHSPSKDSASKDYALIFGTVWGPDDLPVPAIRVKIRKASDKKVRWELYSNRRGEFEQRVPVGPADYVIWADTKGYKLPNGRHLQGSPEVTVHVEKNERADTGVHLK